MNVAFVMMAAGLSADPAPVPAPVAAPAPVVVHGGGCPGCEPAPVPCDDCGGKPGMMTKLRAKLKAMGQPKGDCCDPCGTPVCGKPIFHGFSTAAAGCDDCSKPGLMDRLKAKFKKGGDCCAPACDPCAAAPAAGGCALPAVPHAPPVMAAPPAAAPQAMPAPAPKVEEPKKPAAPAKTTAAPAGPAVVTPAAGTKPLPLGGANSPF